MGAGKRAKEYESTINYLVNNQILYRSYKIQNVKLSSIPIGGDAAVLWRRRMNGFTDIHTHILPCPTNGAPIMPIHIPANPIWCKPNGMLIR